MNAFKIKREAKGRVDVLPPEPGAKAANRAARFSRRIEVVDADFVVIRSSAARTSNDNHRRHPAANARPISDHPLFRLGATCARLCEVGLQRLPGRAFAGLVALAFVFVFAFAGGLTALKAAILPTAQADLLRLTDISAMVDDRNGMKVLTVYGRLANTGDSVKIVPPLDVMLEGSGTRRVVLDAETIAPGGAEHFALRIPHSGGKVPKVSVSLAREGAPAT
jgi:hypothetical protein